MSTRPIHWLTVCYCGLAALSAIIFTSWMVWVVLNDRKDRIKIQAVLGSVVGGCMIIVTLMRLVGSFRQRYSLGLHRRNSMQILHAAGALAFEGI